MESDELLLAEEYHRGYEDGRRRAASDAKVRNVVRPDAETVIVFPSVFLSGPMSRFRHNNLNAFVNWHAYLRDHGITDVYNPALEWLVDKSDYSDKEYLRRTIHELTRHDRYDTILMLPGWSASEGATTEKMVAEACGIRVAYGKVVFDFDEAELKYEVSESPEVTDG